ncbi:RNA polymerase sigma factor [Novosphingobium umbonatum]|uniref:RNA polymerase sigma factor n=1 Tax=Novosphingobium umbonatum TaxID=1908524 RepID=A0A3S3TJ78_9SPHN|nr:RNA polymerase sigma factor [Novosphingobium umbonatum]RVU02312.1 RNA polymerase sigma factor [Novosphingobium umbonatum]
MRPALRAIDQWFIDEILPHEASFLTQARRLCGSAEEAQDLVQDAYVKLFGLDGWAAIDHPQAYMRRVLVHMAIERMRRAKVVAFQQLQEIEHSRLADDAPDAFAVAAGRSRLAHLAQSVARLPERCREVFVRRRLEEQSPTQIARELGLSLSTLEKRLARAYVLLAQDGWGVGRGYSEENGPAVPLETGSQPVSSVSEKLA